MEPRASLKPLPPAIRAKDARRILHDPLTIPCRADGCTRTISLGTLKKQKGTARQHGLSLKQAQRCPACFLLVLAAKLSGGINNPTEQGTGELEPSVARP